MNLAVTMEIYAGGPGSGCNPLAGHCGRPIGKGMSFAKPSEEEMQAVESWKSLPNPRKPNFRQARMAGEIAKDAVEDLRDPDTVGIVARDKDGMPLGIASLYEMDDVTVNYLATSPLVIQGVRDDVHGVGTALMLQAAKHAAKLGSGLVLVALPQSAAFYDKLGMHSDPEGSPWSRYWTKEEVKEIVRQAG